jgi:hypothetical protein
MPIAGGMDIHRKQITFDYLDTATGEVAYGQIAPAGRAHLRAWLERFAGVPDVAFAFGACTGCRRPGGSRSGCTCGCRRSPRPGWTPCARSWRARPAA